MDELWKRKSTQAAARQSHMKAQKLLLIKQQPTTDKLATIVADNGDNCILLHCRVAYIVESPISKSATLQC